MATMLDCKNVQSKISEYIDGAVDGDSGWTIKMHLASCSVCSTAAEELTQTVSLLRALPQPETSAGFEAALAERLVDLVMKPARPSLRDRLAEWWYQPRVRPVFASAAALAAVVPVAFVFAYHIGQNQALEQAAQHAPTAVVSDPSLDKLFNDHMTYASSEPLADSSSGMLQAQSNGASGSDGGDANL